MTPIDPKFRRKMTTARREILKAVTRWQDAEHKGVEFRAGHKAEAARQARAIRDEAEHLVALLSKS